MGKLFTRRNAVIILGLAAVLGIAATWWYVLRIPPTPASLASYLPDKNGAMLYIDMSAMRRSGLLGLLSGAKAVEETDYKTFVQETGFDYQHDLDAIAGTIRSGQSFFVLRGSFDWDRLRAYALKHGGACKSGYCTLDGSTPQKRISFYKAGSRLMALAVSPDDMAAYQIARNASKVNPFTPDTPVWLMVPKSVLRESSGLPSGTKAFAIALEDADRAIFSIAPDGDHLKIQLNVMCKDAEAAANLLVQLESTTNMLRKLLARAHQEPSPKDLSGVLVAGTFRRDDRRVFGEWPIQKVFLDALAGGSN